MATIKTGQVVAEIRGKLNGSVFSRNKGGAYVRQFVKPTNPDSTKQAETRGVFGTLMSDWRALTQAQRDSWTAAADNYPVQNKVGDTIKYSGAQLFCRCNMALLSAGQAKADTIPNTPPAHSQGSAALEPPPWETLSQSIDVANLQIDVPSGALLADELIVVYASSLVSPGVKSSRTPSYRRVGQYAAADFTFTGAAGVADVLTDWKAVFGDPIADPGEGVVFLKTFIMFSSIGFQIPYGTQRVELVASA
jgi:hypothetical protein